MYKLYKKFNIDIKERIDKHVKLNRKIIFKYIIINLKYYFFIKNILNELKNNKYIYFKNYNEVISLYYLDNNVIIFKNSYKIVIPINYSKLKNNKLNKTLIKFCLMLYKKKYKIFMTNNQ